MDEDSYLGRVEPLNKTIAPPLVDIRLFAIISCLVKSQKA